MLGISAKAGKLISGTDYCIQYMEKGKVKLLVLAEDASEKTKKNMTFYAQKYNVPLVIDGEIEALSKAIGKENRAVIGIVDPNLGKAIEKIINGGDATWIK